MAKGLSAAKAKKILQDGYVKGKPLTAKQKKYFGAIASGATPLKKINGAKVEKAQLGKILKAAKNLYKGADKFESSIDWAKWNKAIPENKALMKEYNAIEEATKKNGTWMKNSDGSAFKGTPEQFVQENSENFKKAFPDGFKEGYRGAHFNIDDFVNRDRNDWATFLTDNRKNAESYATSDGANKVFYNPAVNKPGEQVDGIYQLAFPNNLPTVTGNANGRSWRLLDYDDRIARGLNNNNVNIHNENLLNWSKGTEDYGLQEFNPSKKYLQTDNYASYVKNPKNPEVIAEIKNVRDQMGFSTDIPTNTVYAVDAERVPLKSLMYNNGMFDMTNPNIYKAIVPGAIGTAAASQMTGPVREDGQFKNGGWLDKFAMGGSLPGASGMMYSRNSGSSAMSPPNLTKAQDGTVEYGTPEYKKAYEEGTFADVPNQLDEVVMYSGVDYEKYPYYNDLSAEQRKYFKDDGPIGRGVRRAAYTKRGLAEDTYDVVNPLMYGMLGLAGGMMAGPSIATLGRAAAGPIGRALSYKPFGGPVSIGNTIDAGSAAYAAYNTPEAYDKFKENPSFDTGLDLGLTAMDMIPFSEIFTGGKNIKNLYNKGKNLFTKTPTPAVSNTIDASIDPGIRSNLIRFGQDVMDTPAAQIRASEKFNKNWFNHPDVIKKTEQMLNQPSKVRAGMSEIELLQDINMYNTMLDKTPNLSVKLQNRIKDNLKDLKAGLAKRNLETVQQKGRLTEVFDDNNLNHQDMGIHYDENPETLGLYKGRTNQATVNLERIKEKAKDVGSVITHEDLHAITVGRAGYTDEATDILNSAMDENSAEWWLNKINTTKDQKTRQDLINRLEYLARPQEIHARVHELRKAFNLKPGQEVSPSKIEAIVTKGLKGDTPVDKDFFRLLGDKENFRKIFNKLPAFVPAAVGLGAASQNKNGGKTPKAQVGDKVASIASQMEANEEDGGRPPLGVMDHITALFDEEGLCRDNTCVQTVKDFYTKAGIEAIPKDVYNNREFLKNFKEYGFEEVLDQKNLQPGDVLQYYYGPDSDDVKEDPSYLNFPYHMGVYVNPGEYIGDGDSKAPIQRQNMYTGIKDGEEYKKDPFRAFRYIKQNKNGSDVEKAQWGKLLKLAKKYGNKLFNFSKPAAKVDNTPSLKYTDDVDMDMDVFNAKAKEANAARKEYKKVKKNIKDGEGWKYEPGELEKLESRSKFLDETIHFPDDVPSSDVYTNLTRYNLSSFIGNSIDRPFVRRLGNRFTSGLGEGTAYTIGGTLNPRPQDFLTQNTYIRSGEFDKAWKYDEPLKEKMDGEISRFFNAMYEPKTSKIDFGDLLKNKNRNGGWLSKYENGGVIEDDRGQWAHPGKVTKINSNNITMKGVNYPVLGVSDTGDKKMMQPGKDYKFNGNSVTEYPMAQDGLKTKVPDPTPQINFMKDWASSAMHNKMLDASSSSDKFKNKVRSARSNFDDVTIGMFDDPGYLGQYLNSNIRMNPSLLKEAPIGNGYNSILTHELSHYTDDVNPSSGYFKGYNIPLSDQKLIKDYSKQGVKRAKAEEKELNKLLKSENMNPNSKDVIKDRVKRLKYLASPTETRSRINATRYFYENDKNFGRSSERNIDKNLPSIFDSEVTPDMIKVMQESGQYKQLQELYTDDQILEMFNTISDNSKSSDPSNMAYAKEGESLVALDQLTNFTNYNTPQPGGWLDKY